jgi:tetratricopeptide (TPR) repeat protein
VVLQNLGLWWYPVWHFAVVIGYDLDEGSLVLHSGPQARLHLSMATFERTWDRADDWALVVLPPDDAADVFAPAAVLAAAALLEPSAPTAAEAAYRSQLPRAPATAWLGLGNLAMAAGRPAEAAQDYRQALAHDNKLADAWNNLAEAELTVGHLGEAGAAIARAQALGGPHAGAYADTAASVASAAAAAAAASAPAATQDRAPTR